MVNPSPSLSSYRSDEAVVLPESLTTMTRLRQLRQQGASVVLSVGALTPRLSTAPIAGLLAAQLTPEAAALLLDTSPGDSLLAPQRHLKLPRAVRLRITSEHRRRAGALNLVGYVAGKHPIHAQELVLVCSDLDAMGNFSGLRTVDFSHFGLGTAALLEAARNLERFQRWRPLPERSVLFAVWSGARTGHQGLQAYLDNPTWALDKIRTVIYVGLSPEEEPDVRALLSRYGLSLQVIAPPAEPLHTQHTTLLPPAIPNRLSGPRRQPPAVPDLSAILPRAVQAARAMAEETYALTLRESTQALPQTGFQVIHKNKGVERSSDGIDEKH